MITGLPTEYMHLVALGVAKKVLYLLLGFRKDGGLSRNKHEVVQKLNTSLRNIKTPSEFSRRTRDFKVAHWKAEEYRNMLLFFFPLLLPYLDDEERSLWLLLVYSVRAYVLPEDDFERTKDVLQVPTAIGNFGSLFHKMFGSKNCSYNIHVFSHLSLLRQHGPLNSTSSFRFESFLAIIKDNFRVGTPNVTKQIFENMFLSLAVRNHVCRPSFHINVKVTSRTDDTLVRAYGNWFKAVKFTRNDEVMCAAITAKPAFFGEIDGLSFNFGNVGVFTDFVIGQVADVCIPLCDVSSKGIIVGEYIMECPYNVAFEC
jgi:hypothetical protein